MVEGNFLSIKFVDNPGDSWRAADLLPRECCTIGDDIYIKLGITEKNAVELHVIDENRMARGEDGSYKKKHFFFHANSCSIITLIGETQVIPRRMELGVFERITFTPRSAIPFDRDTQPLNIDQERENWGQQVTDAD